MERWQYIHKALQRGGRGVYASDELKYVTGSNPFKLYLQANGLDEQNQNEVKQIIISSNVEPPTVTRLRTVLAPAVKGQKVDLYADDLDQINKIRLLLAIFFDQTAARKYNG